MLTITMSLFVCVCAYSSFKYGVIEGPRTHITCITCSGKKRAIGRMGAAQRRVRHACRTGYGRAEMRWRRFVRKCEMSGVRFCLERDGPSYVEGSGIWGFGSSRICTRNRGLRVGIPLGRCGFDIFGVGGGGWRVGGFAGTIDCVGDWVFSSGSRISLCSYDYRETCNWNWSEVVLSWDHDQMRDLIGCLHCLHSAFTSRWVGWH